MYTIIAIILTLGYLIASKHSLSWVLQNLIGMNKWSTDWIAWVLVVVCTPAILNDWFGYQLTTLALGVFVAYSVVFMLKQITKMALGDID